MCFFFEHLVTICVVSCALHYVRQVIGMANSNDYFVAMFYMAVMHVFVLKRIYDHIIQTTT
jgi:hypothetical protein